MQMETMNKYAKFLLKSWPISEKLATLTGDFLTHTV